MPDLPKQAMQWLLSSDGWRSYVSALIDEFEACEQRYDQTGDAREQGLKRGLRFAIELPYLAAEVESPLTRQYGQALQPLKRKRQARAQRRKPVPIPVPLRTSGLV